MNNDIINCQAEHVRSDMIKKVLRLAAMAVRSLECHLFN